MGQEYLGKVTVNMIISIQVTSLRFFLTSAQDQSRTFGFTFYFVLYVIFILVIGAYHGLFIRVTVQAYYSNSRLFAQVEIQAMHLGLSVQ